MKMGKEKNIYDCKILIVDDIQESVESLRRFLTLKGFIAYVAEDGNSAIAKANKVIPDLIVLDLAMPGMNGIEVCKILKADEKTKKIPIIFLTAIDTKDMVVDALNAGAVDYILKPYDLNELLLRIKIHLELKISKEKIENLNEERDRFYAILSHDLRSPFFGVLGLIDMLDNEFEQISESEKIEIIHSLKTTLNTHYELLNEFILWSQFQKGIIGRNPELLNLKELADSKLNVLNLIASKKNISITNNISDSVYAYSDKKMIGSIYQNLINNAIKFTPENGEIVLSSKSDNLYNHISIKDNGIGMSQEQKEKLFNTERTQSRLGTNQEKGTGFGLILCKEMLSLNDGYITIESEEGKGSIFTFSLPASKI